MFSEIARLLKTKRTLGILGDQNNLWTQNLCTSIVHVWFRLKRAI